MRDMAAVAPAAEAATVTADSTLDDEDRLVEAARGDARAFRVLYERHARAVFGYLRARGASDEDAADLAATTFERALAGLHGYRSGRAGFRPWLLRIARNAAIDASRRRRPVSSLDAASDRRTAAGTGAAELAGLVAPGPEGAVEESEQRAEIRRLVAALPEPQREAIVLRYASGLTAREIGAVIGRSEEATQKLITRALARLKEAYREQE
jgi:RNA polymerase sigma factor (sigma-70 family)